MKTQYGSYLILTLNMENMRYKKGKLKYFLSKSKNLVIKVMKSKITSILYIISEIREI